MTTAARACGWAVVVSCALGCAGPFSGGASKHGYFYRPRPLWAVTGGGGDLGCATAEAWVSKSGVEGVGLTVALRAKQAACTVTLERLTLTLPGRSVHAGGDLPATVEIEAGRTALRYLPVRFENGAAWSDGVVSAAVALTVRAEAGPQVVRFELGQRTADTPVWATARAGYALPCRGGELFITETAPSHVLAVLRLFPAPRCAVRVGAAELWQAGTLTQRLEVQLPVVTRADEPVEIPLRWSLGGRGPQRSGQAARIRVAVGPVGQQPEWHDWTVFIAPERRR